MPGGGKRAKISVVNMKALETDPDMLKAIFLETSFSPMTFIGSLNKEQLTEYMGCIEKQRQVGMQVQATVDRIAAFAAMKVKT